MVFPTTFRIGNYVNAYKLWESQSQLLTEWISKFFSVQNSDLVDINFNYTTRELNVSVPDGHFFEPTKTALSLLRKKGFTLLVIGSTNSPDTPERQWDLTKNEEIKKAA